MLSFGFRMFLSFAVVQIICSASEAKVVSIIDAAGDYTSSGSQGVGRSENNSNYKKPDRRCESFMGLYSAVPENKDCEEAYPLPGVTCYRNCRCAYGTSASCTCNSNRFFRLDNLPFGTEPSGETCTTKTLGIVYYAVRCKNGFIKDSGANTCSCPYGELDGCLCNSREYPLLPHSDFDYENYNYSKCEYGNFYKISGCKKAGYQLINGKCVPKCAEGFSSTITSCGEAHELVEQEGFPLCKKCELITCPKPYTFVNDCPDGTKVVKHPTQEGCFKCEGIPCNGQYHTYNVCRSGQSKKTQPDNNLCVFCEGEPCQEGYTPEVICSSGQITLRQDSNPLCQKCAGTACSGGYELISSCEDGQVLLTQSANPQCKKCSGTPCQAGYSTKIGSCASGLKLSVQNNNPSCRKCVSEPCRRGYSSSISQFNCKDGQVFEQQPGTSCGRCIGTPCALGYSTTTSSCANGRVLRFQSSNTRCRKCDSHK